jgi:hypothetical protein
MSESQKSNDKNIPAVSGENTAGGDGIFGTGRRGTIGVGSDGPGVVGESTNFDGVFGVTKKPTGAGVSGHNDHLELAQGFGVIGLAKGGRGVAGFSDSFQGVFGHSNKNAGVVGESEGFDGVFGRSKTNTAAGVSGHNDAGGVGVIGVATGGRGVAGFSDGANGVFGHSKQNAGVHGESDLFDGVFGVSHQTNRAGISGRCLNLDGSVNREGLAGFFDGRVDISGRLLIEGRDVQTTLADLSARISTLEANSHNK